MLEECDAVYEPVRLEFGGTMKSPDYLRSTPWARYRHCSMATPW
ncbi:hypothetical protein [Comamonas sp. JC664]